MVVAVLLLGTACARSSTVLKNGDTIGDMVLSKDGTSSLWIGDFCTNNNYFQPGQKAATPEVATRECEKTVPLHSRLIVGDGWTTKNKQQLEENWKVITWELYLDGQQVDVGVFGTADMQTPEGYPNRSWPIFLENLAPGVHTRRNVFRISQEIFDGFVTYPVGTYDTTYRFTVDAK